VHTRDAFKRALEFLQWPARPPHQAAYRGSLERGTSDFGATALDCAGRNKQDDVVAYLGSVVDHGGD
jgi:hypothetical protein